jgi:urease accessory protein
MTGAPLLALLHLCDSLFPLGGFAHSDGLEAATTAGAIATGDDLRWWMDACLVESLGRSEGPAVSLAWQAFIDRRIDALWSLDADVHALRPSSTARQASRAMGTRLVKTWGQIRRIPDLGGALGNRMLTLPVAFGVVCASADIGQRATLEAFFYTRLAATISCAMRLMPIGQHEAHVLLADALARVPTLVDGVLARGEQPASFLPALDLAAMNQQYVHSRLFRS